MHRWSGGWVSNAQVEWLVGKQCSQQPSCRLSDCKPALPSFIYMCDLEPYHVINIFGDSVLDWV